MSLPCADHVAGLFILNVLIDHRHDVFLGRRRTRHRSGTTQQASRMRMRHWANRFTSSSSLWNHRPVTEFRVRSFSICTDAAFYRAFLARHDARDQRFHLRNRGRD